MKSFKLFLLLIIVLCSFSSPNLSFGQTAETQTTKESSNYELSFGIGALYSSGSSGSNLWDIDSRLSYQIGALSKIRLHPKVYLRSGLFYARKSLDFNFIGGNQTFRSTFDYLKVPLTVEYMVQADVFRLIAGFNLQYKTALGCSVPRSASLQGVCNFQDVKDFVMPLVFGVSRNLSSTWLFEAFYERGLTESARELKVSSLIFNLMLRF